VERRRYIISYDIRDDVRLRRVHSAMKGFGEPLQYSVFVCDLDPGERVRVIVELKKLINERADSVALIDLGDPDGRGRRCFQFLGVARPLPESGARIV
jgi:CRISPR-associated protein Cas2